MTPTETAHYAKMYATLKRITDYANSDRLRKTAERDYGLSAEEVIEMAYDNVLAEAHAGLRKVRKPTP